MSWQAVVLIILAVVAILYVLYWALSLFVFKKIFNKVEKFWTQDEWEQKR